MDKQANITEKKISVYEMTVMALMTAVTCILAPMSIPIGTIPVTLTNLVLCFSVIKYIQSASPQILSDLSSGF